jgi:hypothetical protein
MTWNFCAKNTFSITGITRYQGARAVKFEDSVPRSLELIHINMAHIPARNLNTCISDQAHVPCELDELLQILPQEIQQEALKTKGHARLIFARKAIRNHLGCRTAASGVHR